MAAPIITHTSEHCDIDYNQVIRYMGMAGVEIPSNIQELLDRCIPDMEKVLKYKSCYLEVPVLISGDEVSFEYFSVTSKNLSTLLRGCDKAIVLAATIGIEADICIKRAEVKSKAEALIFNAVAIAAIESYLGELNKHLKGVYSEYELRPRFSPGYGDVPLSLQKSLLSVIDSNRKIGVSLSDTLLMTPKKSVSAIIGLGADGCMHIEKDCDICSKRDCEYRLT